jgi:aspartyl-tRNA(Asn)/glutamyl-tRNA(Gln) amidotransferase subunit C
MGLSAKDVRETAALARLALDDAEVERLVRELDAILGSMRELAAVEVAGVPPMTHAVALDCPERDDAVGAELSVDQALAAAPAREAGLFRVPRIIAHDKET